MDKKGFYFSMYASQYKWRVYAFKFYLS
jgi:hypothetical protein